MFLVINQMRTTRRLAAFTLALSLFTVLPSPTLHAGNLKPHAEAMPATGTVEVFFSPDGGAEAAIIHELGQAKKEILIQAYSFTSKPIAKAIIEARKRGVKIEAVLDKSNQGDRYTAATFLDHAGVPVLIDGEHAISHSKIFVLDRQTIITGSYNFTAAAEHKNAENLLILKGNPALVSRYLANFDLHKRHSTPFSQ